MKKEKIEELANSDDIGTLPTLLENIQDKVIVQASSGMDHFLFLTSTGEVYSMGTGVRGQLVTFST
jgi:alpha-tubulin suppressor-like RCC1 family protein